MAGTTNLKPAAFLSPFASPDQLDLELKSFLEEASFLLCNWLSESCQGTPLPKVGEFDDFLLSHKGLSKKELLERLHFVMDGSYRSSHPGSLAHLDPPPLTASIVADLISAGLNNNLLGDELSPSLSQLERKLCKWFINQLDMPSIGGGVFASGGSLSNLMALVTARQHLGLGCDPSAALIASEDSHVSLVKARKIMGLPEDAMQLVPTNEEGQISLECLHQSLKDLKLKNKKCFAIVATAGTTVRGAVDPIFELSKITAKEGLWLHVDGAIGGIFALSRNKEDIVRGISLADSVTLNPQKILGIAKTSSLLLVANKSSLVSTFSTGLPYLEPTDGEPHGGEIGIQGTRSAEVLKLWLGLLQLGSEGIIHLLDNCIYRRKYIQGKLDSSLLDILSGDLHIIAISPKNLDRNKSEAWSDRLRNDLLEKKFLVSRSIYKDRYYLKIVLGNPNTELCHLDKLSHLINNSIK